MPVERRFLIARSFARLIRKERGTIGRAVEGYFATSGDRVHFVSIASGRCELVLTRPQEGGSAVEERTEVPRSQAEALLDICAGKLAFDRTQLVLEDGREVFVDRLMTSGALNLISAVFDDEAAAAAFVPPVWFGAEVTEDPSFTRRAVAIEGFRAAPTAGISDSALDALLDSLEGRASVRAGRPLPRPEMARPEMPRPEMARPEAPAPAAPAHPSRSESERRVSEAFRRLAVVTQPVQGPVEAAPGPAADEDDVLAVEVDGSAPSLRPAFRA
jgi:CYTH domain-containing protein